MIFSVSVLQSVPYNVNYTPRLGGGTVPDERTLF